jgi:uncharacterized protein DUF4124
MRRQRVAITVWVILCTPLLPAAALAGGRPLSPRAFHTVGAAPMHGRFRAQPPFRPQGAFGSPGGFPLPVPGSQESRLPRVPPARFSHRLPHHAFVGFPATTVLYAPPALYESPVDSSPPAVSVSTVVYVSPTVYVSPPIVSSQPAPAAAASNPAPPLPSVVEYSTGRYELRGDGVTTPYVWVWIPNPPPVPPAAPPPSAPSVDDPRAGSVPSAVQSKVYRWTDDEGTTHWTNRVESIPEPHRSRAQRLGQVVAQP